jgi:hypothetical protein
LAGEPSIEVAFDNLAPLDHIVVQDPGSGAFTTAEINAAWEWVRTSKNADRVPVRTMYEGKGLFKDYIPEYTEL